ncbi:MAG: hypothetical protein LQ352_005943 [Teloschistes flavicans]|nr:MAG: hypothetical protein LQ352_005943 [Teloschistes flavicans]
MAQEGKFKEFPDIGSKLAAPTKKSQFEKQKAEAEAKRQREYDETAAVYEDFVKSFDDEGVEHSSSQGRSSSGFGSTSSGAPPRRHFQASAPGPGARGGLGGRANSGPGSLGPPPPSLTRKRALDGSQPPRKENQQGLFAFEDAGPGVSDTRRTFQKLDDEDISTSSRQQERAAPKPTIRLSSLPPGTSPAFIKSFLPPNLTIDAVRITPPTGPGFSTSTERRSLSAIITLANDTPAVDIDTAVSALQNKYLGRGFYLSLSRHFSSAAASSEMPTLGLLSATSSLPFGARSLSVGPVGHLGRPSGSHRGGFAPPQSYNPSGPNTYGRGAPPVQVNVRPPSDLKQLKLIHKTLEALLTHGPEFEALLMTRREVQMEEKWAWLWDSRSTGGVYYRWRLWDVLTGASQKSRGRRVDLSSQLLFEGGATWAAPEKGLPFEYVTGLEGFVTDSDYNSSDDDDSGDEGRRRHAHYHGGAPPLDGVIAEGEEQAYLNPLEKAKLAHLLARLPTTNAKLRRGDVARVTAFAIQRAGEGAEEIVDLITSNVKKPFSFSGANPERRSGQDEHALFKAEGGTDEDKRLVEKEDASASMLIGFYIISDILSSSSTSGVRHAWRYRQLFEAALRSKEVFEDLGRLEKTMQWGRLRAEKWKRSVGSVLTLWEGWCVFPQESQEHFATMFANPPMTAEEEAANVAAEKAVTAAASKSRWKTVEEKARDAEAEQTEASQETQTNVETMDVDVDGEPMSDDENVDGEPMADEDEDDIEDEPMDEEAEDVSAKAAESSDAVPSPNHNDTMHDDASSEAVPNTKAKPSLGFQIKGSATKVQPAAGRRRRPRAEDMFADSDED